MRLACWRAWMGRACLTAGSADWCRPCAHNWRVGFQGPAPSAFLNPRWPTWTWKDAWSWTIFCCSVRPAVSSHGSNDTRKIQ